MNGNGAKLSHLTLGTLSVFFDQDIIIYWDNYMSEKMAECTINIYLYRVEISLRSIWAWHHDFTKGMVVMKKNWVMWAFYLCPRCFQKDWDSDRWQWIKLMKHSQSQTTKTNFLGKLLVYWYATFLFCLVLEFSIGWLYILPVGLLIGFVVGWYLSWVSVGIGQTNA